MSENFFKNIEKNLNLKLDESQKKAVLHDKGPALVLAVPGAGKTTVLISRIAYLILEKDVKEREILSITFSRASAIDMKERFDSTFGKNFGIEAKFSTIHSFAYFVLRDYFKSSGVNYDLIEGSQTHSKSMILRGIYKELTDSYLSDDKLDELTNNIGYVKNMMISPEQLKNAAFKNFAKIFHAYEKYKAENFLIDFDDMLSMTLSVFEKNPDILKKYSSSYKYIQIDEGQDTSNVQHRIVSLLAKPSNNIFIVADDDQSIYGFRGANPRYLLNFKNTYSDAKIFYMDTNYRSNKSIVSVSDRFIKQNLQRYNKSLTSKSQKEVPVNTVLLDFQEEQYEFILDNVDLCDIDETAVLFRNNISSIPIIDRFDRLGVPYYVKESKTDFFNHWIVRDMVSFFRLAVDDTDTSAFEKVYYKMNAYISKKALHFVLKNSKAKSVFNTLEGFEELKPFQQKKIRNLGLDFKRLSKKSPIDAISYIEKDLDYLDYLDRRADFLGQSLDSVQLYLSTVKILASRCSSILDFLGRLEDLKSILADKRSLGGIFLSTIHSAKGLEFKNVFIVDLINGEFPSASSVDVIKKGILDEIEEERRLFYVGMTRAKENLYILSFKNRNQDLVPPSMFFQDIRCFTSDEVSEKFKLNSRVHHLKFGKGTVIDVDDSSILIEFDSREIKQLSKSLCLKKNMLKLI